MDTSKLHKFYKRTITERIVALFESDIITQEEKEILLNNHLDLPKDTGNHMVENYISNYSVPFATALNFLIDGEEMIIPMAIEEPSVVAAASFAGKITARSGGFKTTIQKREMIGQVALKEVLDIEKASQNISQHKEEILTRANAAYPSIVQRGGGANDLEIRHIEADIDQGTPEFLVVHIHVDTQEAMGANMINTMMEGISPYLEDLSSGRSLMRILSNYATEALTTAEVVIDPNHLKVKGIAGEEVRDRIIEASQFSWADPYRAVTNNKGVMNGIDAVVLATGNDWRAIEAGVHAYASRTGQYRSLTTWSKDKDGNLHGKITLPLPVGTVGGSINFHPGAKLAHNLLGDPTAKELQAVIASVGLAQNFAAVRALVTEGIQKGHMGLQARSLAISAGAKDEEIDQTAELLRQEEKINLQKAKDILSQIRHK